MITPARVLVGDAQAHLAALPPGAAQLVVTSPPYPMIAMWDALFAQQRPAIGEALAQDQGWAAFEAMHQRLDGVWRECVRVLSPGGLMCVNIGDATRSVGGTFALYPNHARILLALVGLGMTPLPGVIWRKPTNAPTKFMGSGMLPAGAYITLEHEHILVLRKGPPRVFVGEDRARRARSALFWEERNRWCSDVWTELLGVEQGLGGAVQAQRGRSGAFPVELPYRLIQLYSLQGDTVLDPFLGTGTTALAALAAGRGALGVEQDPALAQLALQGLRAALELGPRRARERLDAHRAFAQTRAAEGRPLGHRSAAYGFAVMTRQEQALRLAWPARVVEEGGDRLVVEHSLEEPPPPR